MSRMVEKMCTRKTIIYTPDNPHSMKHRPDNNPIAPTLILHIHIFKPTHTMVFNSHVITINGPRGVIGRVLSTRPVCILEAIVADDHRSSQTKAASAKSWAWCISGISGFYIGRMWGGRFEKKLRQSSAIYIRYDSRTDAEYFHAARIAARALHVNAIKTNCRVAFSIEPAMHTCGHPTVLEEYTEEHKHTKHTQTHTHARSAVV